MLAAAPVAAPAPTEVYTPSLHDALPICWTAAQRRLLSVFPSAPSATVRCYCSVKSCNLPSPKCPNSWGVQCQCWRSEEHTSELQSRGHLVCRLLLEKNNRS